MKEYDPLDLYARIEPMIGFYEAYEKLYEHYLNALARYAPQTVLDVGCGNGTLLLKLQGRYDATGIDLSPKMVQIARTKGARAFVRSIEEEQGRYDAIVAVADVLNYLDPKMLEPFLSQIARCLNPGGVFLADINTLYGFEEVAAGGLIEEEPGAFLAIDAHFHDRRLTTHFTLFEEQKRLWRRHNATIIQHYHDPSSILNHRKFEPVGMEEIALFSQEEPDKQMLILRTRTA